MGYVELFEKRIGLRGRIFYKMYKLRILIATLLLCLIPYIKNLTPPFWYLVLEIVNISLLFVIILVLPIDRNIKIVLLVFYIFIFNINLKFMARIIIWVIKGYNGYYISQKDDTVIREDVTDLFKSAFRFRNNFGKLPDKPSIIVCNYCWDRLENLASIIIPRDLAILGGNKFMKMSKLNYLVKYFIITNENGNSYERMKLEIKNHIDNGRYVFVYVSKSASKTCYISKLRSGMFRIAKELNIPITPLVVDCIDSYYGVITYQNLYMHVGETFYVDDVDSDMYRTRKFFMERVEYFKRNKYIMC